MTSDNEIGPPQQPPQAGVPPQWGAPRQSPQQYVPPQQYMAPQQHMAPQRVGIEAGKFNRERRMAMIFGAGAVAYLIVALILEFAPLMHLPYGSGFTAAGFGAHP